MIDAGPAYAVLASYATRGRLQFNGGFQYSNHGLERVIDRYQVATAFLESRYRLSPLMPRIQPFIGARVGRRWETVTRTGANFKAVGHLFGGSGGFLYQLDRQLGLEIGARFTANAFGDFVFSGDQVWESCLESHRLIQTALPVAVVDCSPPKRVSAQIATLEGRTGSRRIKFSHPGSARSAGALTFWVRMVLMEAGLGMQ